MKSQRKTGFLSFTICISNLVNLFNLVIRYGMTYLLGYKLSQDHLEVFYRSMRSRGGFNNNPNAIQFWTAYKRLLVRHKIKGSEFGNCSPLDRASYLLALVLENMEMQFVTFNVMIMNKSFYLMNLTMIILKNYQY